MKLKGFSLIMFLLAFSFLFIGCNNTDDSNQDDDPEETVPTLAVSTSSFDLKVGDTANIGAEVDNTTETLNLLYVSSNELVVTVNNGEITAIGEGSATITVSIEEYPDVKSVVNVVVTEDDDDPIIPVDPIVITGDDTVTAGETITLLVEVADDDSNSVFWESINQDILSVDQDGVVTGIKGGQGTIRVTSLTTGEFLEKQITVIVPAPQSVEIGEVVYDRITLSVSFKLKATVLPIGAEQDVVWSSSNEEIATIDPVTGLIQPLKLGEVIMKATVKDTNISGQITLNVEPTPMELLTQFHNEDPIVKNIRVYGWELEYNHDLYTSVNNYLNQDLNVIESLVALSMGNRPGTLKESTKYITIHDTGSAAPSANAYAHDSYVRNGGGGASWHYTVGNDGIYHQIPDAEVAFHAGDGSRTYALEDTGVLATTSQKPTFTISSDGYYELNGVKSIIKAPTDDTGATLNNSYVNQGGFESTIGENGNWWMGKTYYNTTYKKLANYGGNRNSIGIESCINQGSDVFLTWQMLAKLVAKLMEENNLDLNHVVQHNYFSGKNCPGTMRGAGMWPTFLKLVEAEYLSRTYLGEYNIQFTSFSPNYIDNTGRIIDLPNVPTRASYNIKITDSNGNLVEEKPFYVNLPAKQA